MNPRKIQTRIKHEILEAYLDRWGGIILNGLRGLFKRSKAQGWSNSFNVRFVYADCFAFEGRYEEDGKIVHGSPLIGIKALDKHAKFALSDIGLHLQTVSILFEKERKRYKPLLVSLKECGYQSRVKEIDSPSDIARLMDKDIGVICADYRTYKNALLNFTGQDYTYSFYLLDPYGSKGVPLNIVSPIIQQDRADVMITFPINDVIRKAKSSLSKQPEHFHHVTYINEMYGHSHWPEEAPNHSGKEWERILAGMYMETLQEQDETLAVKEIPLRFEEMEKTGYYLFLTTHDGTGGLTMNEILDHALISEYDAREERRRTPEQTIMPFLAEMEDQKRPTLPEPDINEVTVRIRDVCQGESIPYREVLKRLVNTSYYHRDIEKAMERLREQNLAQFKKPLQNSTDITFL